MKTLRRHHVPDADYFITAVTFERRHILLRDISLFWDCWGDTKLKAWVMLPDHFHAIINNGEKTISDIVHRFKITYARKFRSTKKSCKVWQNRFYDHIIRSDEDLRRHLDYIHYNPVKHGKVSDPFEYEYSSLGYYYQFVST